MKQLNKRYGLLTAICMVVGIVIGSGVFFKTEDVLMLTGGNALQGLIAWRRSYGNHCFYIFGYGYQIF